MTVFFKEFVYFSLDCLEHFKGESEESFNLKKNKPSEASGSGVQPEAESSASGGKSSNSEEKPSEASGSGAQPESSVDIPISEDLRNYQWDSEDSVLDSDSVLDPTNYGDDWGPFNSDSEAAEKDKGINRALVEKLSTFEENIKKIDDPESLKELKKDLTEVVDIYKSGTSPSAKEEIAQIEKKIEKCDNRISELEVESKSKGKGKGN